MDAWKHVRAILALPFMVTVVIPGTLVWVFGADRLDLWTKVPATRWALPLAGGLLIALGLWLMVTTNRLFATVGKGTLAPWNPPERLVVEGVYRHVRNPMISGVFCILLGEALLAASFAILSWFAIFVVACAIVIPLAEEPGLVRRFGAEYDEYRRNVPRWIPRWRPWMRGEG
jgi:protein-S-isoprenylcysteine O-methyltransferase Ste14